MAKKASKKKVIKKLTLSKTIPASAKIFKSYKRGVKYFRFELLGLGDDKVKELIEWMRICPDKRIKYASNVTDKDNHSLILIGDLKVNFNSDF